MQFNVVERNWNKRVKVLFALVADEINYGLIGVICLPEEVGKYDNLLSNDWINRSDLFFQKKIGAIC